MVGHHFPPKQTADLLPIIILRIWILDLWQPNLIYGCVCAAAIHFKFPPPIKTMRSKVLQRSVNHKIFLECFFL